MYFKNKTDKKLKEKENRFVVTRCEDWGRGDDEGSQKRYDSTYKIINTSNVNYN